MASVTVYDISKKKVSDLTLDDRVFNVPLKKGLIYDAVITSRLNHRSGNASTKGRAEVRGGGAKPFKQKGTGRARQGSTRSPILVGGGVTFGPKPKKYEQKLSKESAKGALRTTLSMQCRDNKIFVLKDFKLKEIKTKEVAKILKKFSLEKALIIDEENKELKLSSHNLTTCKFSLTQRINVYDLIKYQNLMVTEKAILSIQKRLLS